MTLCKFRSLLGHQLTQPAPCLLSAVWPGANGLASLILSSHFCSWYLGTYPRVLTTPPQLSITIPGSSCPGDMAPELGCCLVCGDTCWPHVEGHELGLDFYLKMDAPNSAGFALSWDSQTRGCIPPPKNSGLPCWNVVARTLGSEGSSIFTRK